VTPDEPATPAAERPAEPTADTATTTAKPQRASLPVWQETLLLLAIAVVLAVLLKALLVQAFYIPSESMEPGLVENDRILVQKWSYWGGSPERGDVVVFEDPGGWLGDEETGGPSNAFTKGLAKLGLFPSGGHLVKRVIGVEGDTVTCCDDEGRLSVNGVALDEGDYVMDEAGVDCAGPMTGNCDWSAGPVPAGHVFVMGDNRASSADSTVHMCTPEETDCNKNPFVSDDLVVGKVWVLLWPFDRFGGLDGAEVFADVPDAK
jgi:signal peptidase I